jgi:hypothetical protein
VLQVPGKILHVTQEPERVDEALVFGRQVSNLPVARQKRLPESDKFGCSRISLIVTAARNPAEQNAGYRPTDFAVNQKR